MPIQKIMIVTIDGSFGQPQAHKQSLSLDILKKTLENKGWSIETIEIKELISPDFKITQDYFLFGSHQNPEIKKYIDDIVSTTSLLKSVNFIPKTELILAHENKGIQTIIAKDKGIKMPPQKYLIQPELLLEKTVIKHVGGAGSTKVFLSKPGKNYKKKLFRYGLSELSLKDILFYLKGGIKRIIKWKNYTENYINSRQRYFRHIQQSYIKSPGYDYKVLVFFDKLYVLKREERKGDFRSSGSGKFSFVTPEIDLLKKCLEIRKKLRTPYISLDMIESNKEYQCIEFQCIHFGPYTQIHAQQYYELNEDKLITLENNLSLEEAYSYAIDRHIKEELNSFNK